MKKLGYLTITCLILSCSLPSTSEFSLNGEYAIPLVNDKVTIEQLLELQDNVEVRAASDGKLTLDYVTNLYSEELNELFPSIPSIGEVLLPDSISTFSLSVSERFAVTKALFRGDEMRFRFAHDVSEEVHIHMIVPELSKDGQVFEYDFVLDATQGDLPYTEFTPSFDLSGFEYNSLEGNLTFIYDARNSSNERLILSFAAMSFNRLRFSYGEGSFKRTIYKVQGDSVFLKTLNAWEKGQLRVKDPSIRFTITHSYGIPIAIKILNIGIESIEDEFQLLEGDILNREIYINYPSFEEVGNAVKTTLTVNNENSNLSSLIDERIRYISYDVEAIVNPGAEEDIKGFATDESFFDVEALVRLPLNLDMNELVLKDTIDLIQEIPQEVKQGEFKLIFENNYPIKANVQLVFLDGKNEVVERIFADQPFSIEPFQENTSFVNIESDVLERIRLAKKAVVIPEFDTEEVPGNFVQLLDEHFLGVRVGLKFKL